MKSSPACIDLYTVMLLNYHASRKDGIKSCSHTQS
ncbi:hypothetical protein LINPERPRIM_LOCUS3551 [Linum perenne]